MKPDSFLRSARSGLLALWGRMKVGAAPTLPSQKGGGEKSAQRGISLIDLMIGLTVGLIVILAAVASLMMVRGASRTMTDSAALEQQATLAMLQISQQLSQTGAHNVYAGIDPDAGVPGGTPRSAVPGDTVQFDTRPIGVAADSALNPAQRTSTMPIFGVDGTAPASDTLYISYAVPNDGSPATGCAGNTAAALTGGALRVVSVFAVANQSLTCDTFPAGPNPPGPVPIAANVVAMRVSYLRVDGTGAVTYYANAQAVNDATGSPWPAINGVQVCLELAGDHTQATYDPAITNFTDCDGTTANPIDGRIHRTVRNTFFLRNPL